MKGNETKCQEKKTRNEMKCICLRAPIMGTGGRKNGRNPGTDCSHRSSLCISHFFSTCNLHQCFLAATCHVLIFLTLPHGIRFPTRPQPFTSFFKPFRLHNSGTYASKPTRTPQTSGKSSWQVVEKFASFIKQCAGETKVSSVRGALLGLHLANVATIGFRLRHLSFFCLLVFWYAHANV